VECAHCGLRSAEAAPPDPIVERDQEFIRALIHRSTPFTYLFIGITVGVFALMALHGGMGVMSANPRALIGFGAKDNLLIDQDHEYWRLVTSTFIHIGIVHILLNDYALWIVGQEIERIYGSARFVVLFMATGLVASVASYLFNPGAVSAGASGSIFGLFGALVAFAFRHRNEIPKGLSRDIKRRLIPVIFLNLFIGFSIGIVDNAAHIGGLVAGLILGFIIPYKRPSETATAFAWRVLQIVGLGLIFFSFGEAFITYRRGG